MALRRLLHLLLQAFIMSEICPFQSLALCYIQRRLEKMCNQTTVGAIWRLERLIAFGSSLADKGGRKDLCVICLLSSILSYREKP